MMTDISVTDRSILDSGIAGEGRCDSPLDVVMDIPMATIPVATDSAGATIFWPMDSNEHRTRRNQSEAPQTACTPSNWRSTMEGTM